MTTATVGLLRSQHTDSYQGQLTDELQYTKFKDALLETQQTCYFIINVKLPVSTPLRGTSGSRVLLEKLTVPQLVMKCPAFYGTRRLITAFTSARHLSLS